MKSAKMERPTTRLKQGSYRGTLLRGAEYPQCLEAYYNIPYAQSTAGSNRFRPPVPIEPSNQSFDASKWGHRPPAPPMGPAMEEEGEDCLNLNIFKPQGYDANTKSKLPVMVMFNGGAFNMGSAKARQIDSMLGWSQVPILGVSFNYRVGAFGFLNCKVTEKAGCLNVGLKDQALLLAWVKENIAAFGGDPNQICAVGYSAGAHSIGHHFLNPLKIQEPPFARAILESGAPTARMVYPASASINEIQFRDFLKELKLEDIGDNNVISTLQGLPFQKIRNASIAIFQKYSPSLRWPFQPVIDGHGGIIPIAPIRAWGSGNWFKIPIMTGFCTNEGSVFVPHDISGSKEFDSFFRTLLPSLNEPDYRAIERLYPDPVSASSNAQYRETRAGLGSQYRRIEAAYGQWAYIAPIRQTCHLISSSTERIQNVPPVYLYEYGVIKTDILGAKHSDHIHHTDYMPPVVNASSTNKEVSSNMHAYWTNFISTGDPNSKSQKRSFWEPYQEDNQGIGKKLVFGLGNNEIAGGNNRGVTTAMRSDEWTKTECEFWWKKVPIFEPEKTAKL